MRRLDYLTPANTEDALASLGLARPAYAGGTDLLPRLRLGLADVEALVDVKAGGLERGVRREGEAWTLEALTTLADIEHHDHLTRDLPLLVEAVAHAATPQIRNRATIAGNLLQRVRCAYYRDPAVACWLSGGESCPARSGHHEHHAVLDTSPCIAVHPSDLAVALVAAEASVELRSPSSSRHIRVGDLFAPPTDDRRRLTTESPDELITSVRVPVTDRSRSTYVKAMNRRAWAFALVGVAAVVRVADGEVVTARLVVGGVAATPHRATAAEQLLVGRPLDDPTIVDAAGTVLEDADPLPGNRYKVPLARGLVRRALTRLATR